MIVFSDGAEADLERIFDFNTLRDANTALEHLDAIESGIRTLAAHPEIGRRDSPRSPLRELVISKGATGYIALYEYRAPEDLIVIHAVRHQREAGYPRD